MELAARSEDIAYICHADPTHNEATEESGDREWRANRSIFERS
jgi:hypothetical protein